MKSLDCCISEIKELSIRIEDLEKLIKLLLVNNLIDEANCLENNDSLEIDEKLILALEKHNLKIKKQDIIEKAKVLYIIVPNNIGIKYMMYLKELFRELQNDIEPVFQFEKLNGMKKKRLIEEKISYIVIDKELHIFSLGEI